jgi:hypothetical protein
MTGNNKFDPCSDCPAHQATKRSLERLEGQGFMPARTLFWIFGIAALCFAGLFGGQIIITQEQAASSVSLRAVTEAVIKIQSSQEKSQQINVDLAKEVSRISTMIDYKFKALEEKVGKNEDSIRQIEGKR